ncbi:nosX [Meridianimarinicoccus roseus]|uniref:FAD:protein FMN transferase n=1 Tax=Meridianimarinicoccus roseus TaxID=2072018 RepID=A0A2V2LB57_9RHOB|nr:FAD:protein FMN transferase [Meridianimarinicoccus roseus]PWR02628.1 nosX [Meridianimarinicoccus roseus]
MTLPRRRFLAITAAAGACTALPAPAAVPSWSGLALGAEATITLHGRTEPDAAAALDAAVAALRRIERRFSLFDPASDLVRLNAQGALAAADPDWHELLAVADAVHRASAGRFDPTVQPLWRALAEGRDPAPARALVGWHRVRRNGDAIRLDPGQALTLNGIAQGFATDAVRDVLRRHGFVRMLVNIGEFAADGGPWRLGIADPAQGVVLTRTLTDGAMATSSPGALRLGAQGHILDPLGRTDALSAPWSTVTAEADSAALADAASTALCLAPRGEVGTIKARLPGLRRVTAIDAAGNIATF